MIFKSMLVQLLLIVQTFSLSYYVDMVSHNIGILFFDLGNLLYGKKNIFFYIGILSFGKENLLHSNGITLHNYECSILILLILIGIICLSIFLSYHIHTILHELGHLMGGLVVGSSFISIGIGKLRVTRSQNKKLRLQIHKVYGSGGQCLLGEPKLQSNVGIYLPIMGGILINLTTSILAIWLIDKVSIVNQVFLLMYTFVGGTFVIINGLPIKSLSILNDGRCYFLSRKDELAKECYILQARICRYLSEGYSYKEIPISIKNISKNHDLSNDLIGYIQLVKYYQYIESNNYQMAADCLDDIERYKLQLSRMMKYEFMIETLFLEIITKRQEDKIIGIMNEPLIKSRWNGNWDLHLIRVKIAYGLYIDNDKEVVTNLYKTALYIANNHSISGDARFNMNVMNEIMSNKKEL